MADMRPGHLPCLRPSIGYRQVMSALMGKRFATALRLLNPFKRLCQKASKALKLDW